MFWNIEMVTTIKQQIQKQTKVKQYRKTPEDNDPQTHLSNKQQNIVLPNKNLNTNKLEF